MISIYQHLKFAWKNTRRKIKQSVIVFLCSFIASLNIFIQISQTNGVDRNLYKAINEVFSGQFVLHNSSGKVNILESQFSEVGIFEFSPTQIDELYKNNVKISSISPRIRFDGLIAHKDQTIGINFQAIEFQHLERINSLIKFREGGISSEKDAIVISAPLAEALEAKVGDSLVVLANNRFGYLSDTTVIVSGIFDNTGVAEFLTPIMYVSYEKGKELTLLADNEYMELVINFVADASDQQTADFVNAVHSNHGDLKLSGWRDTAPLLSSIVSIWKQFGYMTQLVFIVFSFMILVNIIVMMTNQRKKEFGTLLAIGFRPGKILQLICIEYLLIVAAGVISACLIVSGFSALLGENGFPIPSKTMQAAYLSSYLKPHLFIFDIVFILGLFSISVLLAVLVSAYKQLHSIPSVLLRHST